MLRTLLAFIAIASAVALAAAHPPAARAAQPNAHPDLSGVWTWYIEPGQARALRGGAPLDLPFTPPAKQKVDAYRALMAPTGDNPGAHCLGYGMPGSMTFSGGYPMEIIQRTDQITVIYEAHSEIRHWYLGSKIIPAADRIPARNGYSTAHWENDTLVVETSALKEQEDGSYPHSDQALIVERYHLEKSSRGAQVLVAEWTLTDPSFYTRPIQAVKKWALDPKGILLPYECNEETWLDHLEQLRKGKTASAAYK